MWATLSGRVQCLDTIHDCLPTLYTMRLLPATGTLGDVSLFGPSGEAVVERSRRGFLHESRNEAASGIRCGQRLVPRWHKRVSESWTRGRSSSNG